MTTDFKTLEKLLVLAKKHKLAELEVENGKNKFRIKTSIGARPSVGVFGQPFNGAAGSHSHATALDTPPPLSDSPKKLNTKEDDRYVKVLSPFVGTFYRSPSPEADSYVSEGQVVKKGDVLCIIEAMKLMNEIECESNGKVVSVLAENGQPVEYGEPLFLIDPV